MIAEKPRMQSLTTLFGDRRPRGALRRIDWLVAQLCSFELVFALFLYSNELKTIVPFPFPIDETVVFGGAAIGLGSYVVWREGLALRGLPLVTTAFMFISWATITVFWSMSHKVAYKSVAYLFTFTMLSVVSGAMVISSKRERTVRFFYCALGIALFMAVVGLIIQVKTGDFRRWSQLDGTGRAYLAFGHTVVNGCGIAFCIALFSRFLTIRQAAGIIIFGICSGFLLIGGGRGPFLGAALAALVAICTRPPEIGRGKFQVPYAAVMAVAMFAIAVAFVAYLFISNNMTTTLARFTKLQEQADQSTGINGINRWDLWKAAYSYWLTAPIIGHGLNSFAVMFIGQDLDGLHPHDIFLEILCEMGIIGMIFFLIFMWSGIRNASFARLRHDPLMVCVLLYFITSSMSALFGRDIVGVRKFFLAICLFALKPPPSPVERASAEQEAQDEEMEMAALAERRAATRRQPALARGANEGPPGPGLSPAGRSA